MTEKKMVTYGPPKFEFSSGRYKVWTRDAVTGKTELDHLIKQRGYKRPVNTACWALCSKQGKRWRVRRIVWGRLLAREEKREGEVIRRAAILLRDEP